MATFIFLSEMVTYLPKWKALLIILSFKGNIHYSRLLGQYSLFSAKMTAYMAIFIIFSKMTIYMAIFIFFSEMTIYLPILIIPSYIAVYMAISIIQN